MNMPQKKVKSKFLCKCFRSELEPIEVNSPVFHSFPRYKEGRVILEQALITESEGFPDPFSQQPTTTSRHNNQNHYQE